MVSLRRVPFALHARRFLFILPSEGSRRISIRGLLGEVFDRD
jgi:hypothetical protein